MHRQMGHKPFVVEFKTRHSRSFFEQKSHRSINQLMIENSQPDHRFDKIDERFFRKSPEPELEESENSQVRVLPSLTYVDPLEQRLAEAKARRRGRPPNPNKLPIALNKPKVEVIRITKQSAPIEQPSSPVVHAAEPIERPSVRPRFSLRDKIPPGMRWKVRRGLM